MSMPADVAAALEQVTFMGAEPPARPRVDPAVLQGLRAAAVASIEALPAEPEPLQALVGTTTALRVNLDFVALLAMVGEDRAWEILAKLKEATDA